MPILYKYLWYYDSSCCVCGLLLNTYNIMGNYTIYPAKWNIWGGGHFWKFAVSSSGGRHKKFKSYLFHHLSVPSFWNKAEGGGGQFSEVLMSIFSDEKLTTLVIMKGWHINSCFTIPTISELEKKKKSSSDLLSSSFTSRRGNSKLSTSLFLRCFCLFTIVASFLLQYLLKCKCAKPWTLILKRPLHTVEIHTT